MVRRATDPAQRAQTRLIIQNGYTASLENAYYDFMTARGDVEATLTEFGGDLVQSLLGKSQEVDIYCADAQLPAYEAALSRGYLPAIEDEAVQALSLIHISPASRCRCARATSASCARA